MASTEPEHMDADEGEMTIVRIDPGDRVLIALKENIDPDLAVSIKTSMNERFPGTEFTIITGVAGIGYASA